ncbi:MAG TPA: four helix bundle protein [Acidobacteriaceae bacterium]|nr:four helix bundle protein [Acidobacteriaceae bacterium]
MKARHFRDLQVWQRSMGLARDVFRITMQFPKSQTFGLASQMQRVAVSIPSNIAEGHGRLSNRSFALFLSQARGSLNELETQVELARQMGFAEATTSCSLLAEIGEIARMLNALLTAVRQTDRSRVPEAAREERLEKSV